MAAGALLVGMQLSGGSSPTGLVVPGIIVMVCMVLLAISSALRTVASSSGGTVKDRAAAEADGRMHLAVVLSTRATGTSINDQPVCDIDLIVAADHHPPYRTQVRQLVNLGVLPSLQRGAVVVVIQQQIDRPEVVVVTDPSDEWMARVDADTTVRALRSAEPWVVADDPRPSATRLRHIPLVLFLVAFVIGAGIRLYPARAEIVDLVTGTPLSQVQGK